MITWGPAREVSILVERNRLDQDPACLAGAPDKTLSVTPVTTVTLVRKPHCSRSACSCSAGALFRSRAVPRWQPILLALGAIATVAAPGGGEAGAAGHVPLAVALVALALELRRGSAAADLSADSYIPQPTAAV